MAKVKSVKTVPYEIKVGKFKHEGVALAHSEAELAKLVTEHPETAFAHVLQFGAPIVAAHYEADEDGGRLKKMVRVQMATAVVKGRKNG